VQCSAAITEGHTTPTTAAAVELQCCQGSCWQRQHDTGRQTCTHQGVSKVSTTLLLITPVSVQYAIVTSVAHPIASSRQQPCCLPARLHPDAQVAVATGRVVIPDE